MAPGDLGRQPSGFPHEAEDWYIIRRQNSYLRRCSLERLEGRFPLATAGWVDDPIDFETPAPDSAAPALVDSADTITSKPSNIFVFGDSLSDVGNQIALRNPAEAANQSITDRWRNHPVWVNSLADDLGLIMTPAYATPELAGNNFAVRGALSGYENRGSGRFRIELPGLLGQIEAFETSLEGQPAADPSALYIVYAGGNDLLASVEDSQPDFSAVITSAVTNIAAAIGTLQDLGAEHFVVPNLADLGVTPLASTLSETDPDTALQLTDATIAFNQALDHMVTNALGPHVSVFDVFGTLNLVLAKPGEFGFTNIEDGAKFNPSADPDQFVFRDGIHPTAAMHTVFADTLYVSLFGTAVMSVAEVGVHDPPLVAFDVNGPPGYEAIVRYSIGENYVIQTFLGEFGGNQFAGQGKEAVLTAGVSGATDSYGSEGNDLPDGGRNADSLYGVDDKDTRLAAADHHLCRGDMHDDSVFDIPGADHIDSTEVSVASVASSAEW